MELPRIGAELLWILLSLAVSIALIAATLASSRSPSKKGTEYIAFLIAAMSLAVIATYTAVQIALLVVSGYCRPYLGGTGDTCSTYILLMSAVVGIDVPASTYFVGMAIKASKQ